MSVNLVFSLACSNEQAIFFETNSLYEILRSIFFPSRIIKMIFGGFFQIAELVEPNAVVLYLME